MEKIIAQLAEMLASAEQARDNAQRSYLEARKVYESGGQVAVSPVLARWGVWVEPYIISNNTGGPFDLTVSALEFYNCGADLGRYLAYYIPEGSE